MRGFFGLVWMQVILTKRGGMSASPHELPRAAKIVKGLCQGYRKTVMLLLPYFISNHFGKFITQGHYHKLCFVLADYAVD